MAHDLLAYLIAHTELSERSRRGMPRHITQLRCDGRMHLARFFVFFMFFLKSKFRNSSRFPLAVNLLRFPVAGSGGNSIVVIRPYPFLGLYTEPLPCVRLPIADFRFDISRGAKRVVTYRQNQRTSKQLKLQHFIAITTKSRILTHQISHLIFDRMC